MAPKAHVGPIAPKMGLKVGGKGGAASNGAIKPVQKTPGVIKPAAGGKGAIKPILPGAAGRSSSPVRPGVIAPAAKVGVQGGAVAGQATFPKIKGTFIQQQKGGISVRVCQASGKTFAPNDVMGAQKHLEKLATKGAVATPVAMQPVQQAMKKKKGERPPRKELSELEKEELKLKFQERHLKKVEKENRLMKTTRPIQGEVMQRGRSYFWVKPSNPAEIPADVAAALTQMCDEFRAKSTEGKGSFCGGTQEDVVYCAMADREDESVVIKQGMTVKFLLYSDTKGVGGCNITVA